MMGLLTDFEFKSAYHKLNDNVAKEFFMPCMRNSVLYKRISGYFGSTVYLISWSALKEFIQNGGKMRILCSPYLTDDDAAAIRDGVKAKTDNVLYKAFQNEFNSLLSQEGLSSATKLLACMIANGVLEIRLVIARDGHKNDPN